MQRWLARMGIMFCGLVIAVNFFGAHPVFGQAPDQPPNEMGPPPEMGGAPPGMNVDHQLSKMVNRYSLTDEQKAQIRPVLVDVKQKLDAVFLDSSLGPDDRSAKLKSIHDDEVARISALMTDDQRAKYQKDQAQMREGQGPGGPGGPPPPDE